MNFIFDLDGTICFKGQPVSAKILDALLHLESRGHTIGFASARPCRDIYPVLDRRFHEHLLIGGNGSVTFYRGNKIRSLPFPEEVAQKILQLLEQHKASCVIDGEWDYAYRGASDHPFLANVDALKLAKLVEVGQLGEIIKILVLSCEDFAGFRERLQALDVVVHNHSSEQVLDFTYRGVSKMSALEEFGIQAGEFVCFGNDSNDVSMFEKAKHSVLIGQHPELLALGKEQILVTDDFEDILISKLEELAKVAV